jgi:hypothetical protein
MIGFYGKFDKASACIKICNLFTGRSLDSVVGIATGYRLDDREV